jgi:hypothetical protein
MTVSINKTGIGTKVCSCSRRRNPSLYLGTISGILSRDLCLEGIYADCKFSGNNLYIFNGVLGFEVALNALCSFQNLRWCM